MRDTIGLIPGVGAAPREAWPRLAEALDSACEGLLLIDAGGRVAMASARLGASFPELAGLLVAGTRVGRLISAVVGREWFPGDGRATRQALRRTLLAVAVTPVALRLADGRWLSITAGATHDGGMLLICTDITDLKQREVALAREKFFCDIALDNMVQGLCLYAPDATLRMANRRYNEMFAVDPAATRPGTELRSLLAASVLAGQHGTQTLDEMEAGFLAMVARGLPERVVLSLADGRQIAFDHVPMPDGGWLASFEDVTERRRSEETIQFLARHDPLTGLANRMMLNERLEQAIAGVGRRVNFALFCLDLDEFKAVNDNFSHFIGDRVLRLVAERLAACVRETDFVCRLGGDEFAIIQNDVSRPEQVSELAQRVIGAAAMPFEVDGRQVCLGVSIGIAMAPEDGMLAEALLKHADTALHRAKLDGRGTYRLFEPALDAKLQARRAMEADLRGALAAGQFELFYQPLVDVAARRVIGFEALLRWRHPGLGMVSPAQFIPLAEETGLIVAIGDWVLRAACAAAARWPRKLLVAVNVSPIQFKAGGLGESVAGALAESGLSPRRLELEVTESILLADGMATLDLLRGLRARGVRISMDDFGTGYSSLSYLRSFPFDKIKIDQSFVRDLEESVDSAAIVGAIIGLGRSLGMRVTAEGVETSGQLARLRAAGCDEVQGYLFSRPRPEREVEELIGVIDGALVA